PINAYLHKSIDEFVGYWVLITIFLPYWGRSFLNPLVWRNTITKLQSEFCFRSFSAQEMANVETRSLIRSKSVSIFSNERVVAIIFLFAGSSKSKVVFPSKSCFSLKP